MKKIVEMLFGKPFKKQETFVSKYFSFAYWSMATFYGVVMVMLIVNTVLDPSNLVGLLIAALFFPLVFRLIYSFIGKFNGLEKEI